MKRIFIFLFLMASLSGFAQNKNTYHIVRKIPVQGNQFWDYLTVGSQGNLFVSHGDRVQVLNTKSGKVIATMKGLHGVHGIALAPRLNKGFITSGEDSVVAVFNLKTYRITNKIKSTGAKPDCIVYDPYSNKVYAFNGHSNSALVVDANTEKIVTTIPLPGKPEFAVTNDKGKIYVNIEDKSMLACIDTKNLKLINSWSIAPGEEPSGLAADFANNKLFSVCRNKIMVVFDTQKEKVVATLPTGGHTDGAGFDPALKRAYSSNGSGTLTVVQEEGNHFKVLEQFPTEKGARTNCVDPITHHIYLPTAQFYPLQKGEHWPKMKPGTFVILDVAP
ncbi:MAG: YncE family protein [Bacteroidales bacterium]|nr:YncE family protein [Bacteroidales bacterium]